MIALLSGTFDPIHNGHLYIADEAMTAFSLKKILFIPNRSPPHRAQTGASSTQRAAMVKLAIDPYDHFEFSDVELERPAPSYTIDTVKTLARSYPDDELALIVGFDAYAGFTTWLHWEEILDYCKLIVINRSENKHSEQSDAQIDRSCVCSLEVKPCHISATQIRQLLAQNKSIDGLVPDVVKQYIETHKLYKKIKNS